MFGWRRKSRIQARRRKRPGTVSQFQIERLEKRCMLAGDLGGASSFDLGPVNFGIQVWDGAVGAGYIMFSQQNLFTRFESNRPHHRNSEHLVAVRLEGDQWQYNHNASDWESFEPSVNDRLLAEVDFELDVIQSLQGATGQVDGIEYGFATGDLTFAANVWDQRLNYGEFTVDGTHFSGESSALTYLGGVNLGIQGLDGATGEGYLLFSEEVVHDRFAASAPHSQSSDHLIAVRYQNSLWEYAALSQWVSFEPEATDRLLAHVNYSEDTVTSLQGASGNVGGIAQGYVDGDLLFYADRWNNSSNNGEFTILGSFFQPDTSPQRPLGQVNRGIQVVDNATGSGYILWSFSDVGSRFIANPPHQENSDRLIAVQFENDVWSYSSTYGWHEFTPSGHDRLIARVDFDGDEITSLEGAAGYVSGIEQGFASGDLTFASNVWDGKFNRGEFTVSGTSFLSGEIEQEQFALGQINRGIQVDDRATGDGFVLFSVEDVAQRFSDNPPHAHSSDHLIAVRYRGGGWEYGSTFQWHSFVPRDNDRLVASVDFSARTISSLESATGHVFGIEQGFVSGDLTFASNVWDGKSNPGEFTVAGTFFSDEEPVSGAVDLDWVNIGNAGNAADQTVRQGGASGFGQVDYEFEIGKTLVTSAQYVVFLNSVASVADPNNLYDTSMYGPLGGILRGESGGEFEYVVKSHWADRPVNYVAVYDAMRFVNWLENGQPVGEQNASTTEDGTYTITQSGVDLHNIIRNPDSNFTLPTEDEWYKAAYHEPGASGDDYWAYPTRSDVLPSPGQVDAEGNMVPGTNIANIGSGNLAKVLNAGPDSESFYGVADMAGHLWEWTESIITPDEFTNPPGSNPPSNGTWRAIMGGSRFTKTSQLSSQWRHPEDPFDGDCCRGFRVAMIGNLGGAST